MELSGSLNLDDFKLPTLDLDDAGPTLKLPTLDLDDPRPTLKLPSLPSLILRKASHILSLRGGNKSRMVA